MIEYLILLIFVIFIIEYYALKKINNLKTFLYIFFFTIILNLFVSNINFALLSILFCYIYFCFLITVPGIKNLGPSLILIKIIKQNCRLNKNKIKIKFLKENFVNKRIKENFEKKLIYKTNKTIGLSKIGKIIIKFFNKLLKIYNLNADIK